MFKPATYNARFLQNLGQNDATKYGVTIQPTILQPGQSYWRVIGVHHLTGPENHGQSNVFLEALDENGNRVRPAWVRWTWKDRRPNEPARPILLDKPINEPGGNINMGFNQTVTVWMIGQDPNYLDHSDQVTGLHTRHDDTAPEPGNYRGHHSFYIVFQKAIAGQQQPEPDPDPTPTPTPEPGDWRLHFGVGELWLIEECRKRPQSGPFTALVAKMAGVLDAMS